MEIKKITFTHDAIHSVAQELAGFKQQCAVYSFEGTLEAGKTTLIKALLTHWGIAPQEVISPTFTYVNVYETAKHELLYHFDLYRITSLNEFYQAGFNEFLYLEKSWSFIEWPEIIKPLLTQNTCFISLHFGSNPSERIVEYYFSADISS